MLAPKNTAFPLELGSLMTTTYNKLPPKDNLCPVMSVTLDLITNSTIRGFVGIFRRNMPFMTVDFACIIDPGNDEPSCVLGLWRKYHINPEDNPILPDRYAEDPALVDSIRGDILMKRMSATVTSIREAVLQVEIAPLA
jgi:hypothetical protein